MLPLFRQPLRSKAHQPCHGLLYPATVTCKHMRRELLRQLLHCNNQLPCHSVPCPPTVTLEHMRRRQLLPNPRHVVLILSGMSGPMAILSRFTHTKMRNGPRSMISKFIGLARV